SSGEQFSKQTLVRVIKDRTPTVDPNDVDGDGMITPIDVLILINHINSQGSGSDSQEGEPGLRIDIDGDGHVSPIDVLILINVINDQLENDAVIAPPSDREVTSLSGEGEGSSMAGLEFGFVDDIASDVRKGRRHL
ncbi:MAG: dockerin type I domain-containing protein, partial [Pirellula sp.]